MTVKILLSGSKGRMGTAIKSIAEDHDCIISSSIDLGDNPENDVKMRCNCRFFSSGCYKAHLLKLPSPIKSQL